MAFDAKKLYVGNLPYTCTFKDLRALFARIVPVSNAEIMEGRDGKSKGHGVLQFATVDDLQDVLAYHKHSPIAIGGRVLTLRIYSERPPERDDARRMRELLNIHPADYKSAPDSFLIYNIPPERRDPKTLFQVVHSAYKHVTNVTLHTTSVKDWRNEGVKDPVTYAIVYISKEAEDKQAKQTKVQHKGKSILLPEQAAANIFKKLKSSWGITAESGVLVRPHDTKAYPRMTTVIVRNLPFTIFANTIFETIKAQYPLIEMRLPSRTINGKLSGTGFAFLVLATHADALKLVEGAKLRMLHHTGIVDWGLDKNTFERQQQVIARASNKAAEDADERSRSVSDESSSSDDRSGGGSNSDGSEDSYSGSGSHSALSDSEPSFEMYEEGKTVIKPVAHDDKEQSYNPEQEHDYGNNSDNNSGTDGSSDLLDREIEIQNDTGPKLSATVNQTVSTPAQQEEIERTIFVTNLPARVSAARMEEAEQILQAKNARCRPQDILVSGLRFELRRLFSAFGMVRDVSIVVNKVLDRHTGSAFIIFKKRGAALCAMEYYNSLKNQAYFNREGRFGHSASHTLAVGDGLDDPYMRSLANQAAQERGDVHAPDTAENPEGHDKIDEKATDPDLHDVAKKQTKKSSKQEESSNGEDEFFNLKKTAARQALTEEECNKLQEIREAAKAGDENAYTRLSREEIHRLILSRFRVPDEYVDLANGLLVISGSPLTLKPAIERQQLKLIEKHRTENTNSSDPRNLALAKIGLLIPGIDGFARADVPPEDVRKRIKYWKTLKGLMTNQSVHISRTRIVIRNIPKEFDERRVSWIVIRSFGRINESEARAMFDSSDANYEYKVAMKLLKSVGCTEMRFRRGTKAYNLVKSMDCAYNEEGYMDGQHSGFCFVEFTSHESALRCLLALNNNPRSFYRDRRPICEFAAENVRTLFHRSQRDVTHGGQGGHQRRSMDSESDKRHRKHEYTNDWIAGSRDSRGKGGKSKGKHASSVKKDKQELTRFDGKGGPVRERNYDRTRPKSKAKNSARHIKR